MRMPREDHIRSLLRHRFQDVRIGRVGDAEMQGRAVRIPTIARLCSVDRGEPVFVEVRIRGTYERYFPPLHRDGGAGIIQILPTGCCECFGQFVARYVPNRAWSGYRGGVVKQVAGGVFWLRAVVVI